jgi:DNA-binding beta-propeller fold protein YncE
VVTTVAGSGIPSFFDAIGPLAGFNGPYGVAVDASGSVYVADSQNQRVRKINTVGGANALFNVLSVTSRTRTNMFAYVWSFLTVDDEHLVRVELWQLSLRLLEISTLDSPMEWARKSSSEVPLR